MFASIIRTPERLLDWRAGDWDTFIYEPYEVPGRVAKALVALGTYQSYGSGWCSTTAAASCWRKCGTTTRNRRKSSPPTWKPRAAGGWR